MNFHALDDVRSFENLEKEDNLSSIRSSDSIKKMEELKEQLDDYLKQNLDILMGDMKNNENKNKLKNNENLSLEKGKNEEYRQMTKQESKNEWNVVLDEQKCSRGKLDIIKEGVAKGAKLAFSIFKRAYPFVMSAVKKMVLKV